MDSKISGIDPNIANPDKPDKNQAPVDPSNTSNIGQKVEQGVIDIKEGISEQSSEWDDSQERNIPQNSGINDRGENYLKDPSPEDMDVEDNQQ